MIKMTDDEVLPDELEQLAAVFPGSLEFPDADGEPRWMTRCISAGYEIRRSGRMIALSNAADALVPSWIEKEFTPVAWDRLRAHAFLSISSTSDLALELARSGAPEGTLVWAAQQLSGRGRHGRTWHSPAGAGLYFSLVLRPGGPPHRFWPVLTHAASLALLWTLESGPAQGKSLPEGALAIKWPNDLLISGKKVAGILLEVAHGAGSDAAAVLGVGVNVRAGAVPPALRGVATSLEEEMGYAFPRRVLLSQFIEHIQKSYLLFRDAEFERLLSLWQKHSPMCVDTPVEVTEGDRTWKGVTRGLTDIGALVVLRADGQEVSLLSGDIRVRRISE